MKQLHNQLFMFEPETYLGKLYQTATKSQPCDLIYLNCFGRGQYSLYHTSLYMNENLMLLYNSEVDEFFFILCLL